MNTARVAFIQGIGFWSSRLPGWDVAAPALRGSASVPLEASRRPVPALLPATERRRAPDTVAVALEVASRACESAAVDPATLASVFASTHGDLAISDYMCETLATNPTLTSPTRFHNSVHNAAAGYWTIAAGCYAPYTAVTAHAHTFGEGLLEALTQVAADGAPVLYVAYDIEARGPMATMAPSRGLLGAALVLAPAASPRSAARLAWRTCPGHESEATAARPGNLAAVEGNAMAHCLPLFECLAQGSGSLRLSLSPQLLLEITVSPGTEGVRT